MTSEPDANVLRPGPCGPHVDTPVSASPAAVMSEVVSSVRRMGASPDRVTLGRYQGRQAGRAVRPRRTGAHVGPKPCYTHRENRRPVQGVGSGEPMALRTVSMMVAGSKGLRMISFAPMRRYMSISRSEMRALMSTRKVFFQCGCVFTSRHTSAPLIFGM